MPANLENSRGHRTGKGQFSFQSQRKAMLKNAQTTAQLHSSQFSSVQSLSCVRLFATPWTAAHQASLYIIISRSSPKLMCIELVMSDSCESSRWCRPVISSSVIPFSSYPQSLLPSGSFPMSQLFARGGQSIGGSASASVLPVNIQDWSPLGWTYTPIKSKK